MGHKMIFLQVLLGFFAALLGFFAAFSNGNAAIHSAILTAKWPISNSIRAIRNS